VAQAFAPPALPVPASTADAINNASRISTLIAADPPHARQLVQDAAQRGDRAFLAAADAIVAGSGGKNSWQNTEAKKIASEIAELVEEASWSPDIEMANVAVEQIEMYRNSFRWLIGTLARNDGLLPDSVTMKDALAPLVAPPTGATS
jgi:hypothetical protein